MSGMGGLNHLRKRITRTEKQYAIVKRPLTIENHLCRRKNNPRLTASDTIKIVLRHILLFGEPLIAFSTKCYSERNAWLRVINSGMVIMKKIGQSACLLPKSAMIGYGRASETERIWVSNEGLINLSWSKIQSSPLGNLWESECLFKLSAMCYKLYFYLCYNNYKKNELKIHNINITL
jgi:hypothetical protein